MSRIAEQYFSLLTSLPELEVAREKIKVEPDMDAIRKLEETVPFVIGSEFLEEKWFRTAFERLHDIFCEEIRNYQGSVAMYLAELSQQLHVPERIFFHLKVTQRQTYYFSKNVKMCCLWQRAI